MEKLAFFAFVLSLGVLFAFLRVPETPTLTLAARTPCEVAAVHPSANETSVKLAAAQLERLTCLAEQ